MIKIHLAIACIVISSPIFAQDLSVQPIPQHISAQDKRIDLPDTYSLAGEADANPYAVDELKDLLVGMQLGQAGLRIYVGEKGDKAIRKFDRKIPQQKEGYYLAVREGEIVLAGSDERGTYYAIQTLRQLLKDGRLPVVEITDFPSVPSRGVVEGFYGTPWSHEARLRQLRFYGQQKMNTYIYGPKDDPYHSSPNWRKPYPEQEARQLQELVRVARQNEVDFVWAIHPGLDIRWIDEDRDLLVAKFQQMYDLGVRSFAVFFDDISGEGTNPEKQAQLLNYIDEKFVQPKPDVKPLIMCPTEYNKSWSNPERGYLTVLGRMLNPTIRVMWTGDRVISDITSEGIAWINEQIQRPAYIWWNFPVSDYVRDHLLLGPVYGNDTTIAQQMTGFVTNPMEHAEASKIAIYGVASYAWNPSAFDSNRAWKDAIATLLPQADEELTFFATHNSDLGENGHKYRREESVGIQPTADHFRLQYESSGGFEKADFDTLEETFGRMVEVSDILSAIDHPLIEEIRPWLLQFKLTGQAGGEALRMAEAAGQGSPSRFLRKYKHVKALQQQMFQIDQTYNQNPYQPGVKTATKVLKPLIDATFREATLRYNKLHGTQLDATTDYMPHKLESDVEQLKNLPLQVKTNRIQVSPALEVIKWKGGASLTLLLDRVYTGQRIEIDLGKSDVAQWGRLEVSADGNEWTPLDFQQEKNRISADLLQRKLCAVRFTNARSDEQEVYLRKFTVSVER